MDSILRPVARPRRPIPGPRCAPAGAVADPAPTGADVGTFGPGERVSPVSGLVWKAPLSHGTSFPPLGRACCATTSEARMKALTQDRYGTADVLEFRDIEPPTPREGQVLVRVVAAGMDRGAWHFMAGEPYLMRMLGFGSAAPSVAVPGTNFAGVVEAVGPGVSGFEPGDEVYGATRGTFAEYVVAPIGKVAPKPPQLSFEQAAVLPYPTLRRHAGAARPRPRPAGPAGARRRRVRRCRHDRSPARGRVRRHSDRRVQRRPRRPCAVARRRRCHRLHERRLHRRLAPVRPDHRHRRPDIRGAASPRTDADGDARHRRRRGRPVDRWHPATAVGHASCRRSCRRNSPRSSSRRTPASC